MTEYTVKIVAQSIGISSLSDEKVLHFKTVEGGKCLLTCFTYRVSQNKFTRLVNMNLGLE